MCGRDTLPCDLSHGACDVPTPSFAGDKYCIYKSVCDVWLSLLIKYIFSDAECGARVCDGRRGGGR